MVRDDIELVDKEYFRIPLLRPNRKIKFKGISFKNILSRWNNFRLNRKKKKLAAKKEKLVEMEIPGKLLKSGRTRDIVEKDVLKKTQAIAKLESKINFLENGEYLSEEFVDSRAIKLKALMMENLVYNRNSLYSVNEKTAEQIMSENNVNSIIDEESKKIGARVKEIQAEIEAEKKAEIAAKKAENEQVENNEEKTEVPSPVVSNDEVAAAIDNEMSKIKDSENENSTAKVNKFINEDGTYRLTRNDIDPELRFTYFDRSKLQTNETTPADVIPELNISPFTATERIKPNVESPRKAITPISELKGHEFPQIVLPTIKQPVVEEKKEVNESTEARAVPVVVPERESYVVKSTKVQSKTSDIKESNEPYGDLGALMAKVSLLRAEKATIDNMAREASEKASNVDAAHRAMMKRLSAYAASLEDECNASYQSMSEVEKNAAAKEAQINAMLEIMENSAIAEESQEAKGGRVRR